MKEKYNCDWCGVEVYRYPCNVGKHVFCCSECRSAFLSKETNPNGYIKHPHLSRYNAEHNSERMTVDVRKKLRASRAMVAKKGTYLKFLGRHLHRVIAEQKIGRKLRPGEIVHHIDGNKHNNSPANLMILSNQAEHARLHKLIAGKKVMPSEVHTS